MKRISEISFLLSLVSLFIMSCASNTTKNNGIVATDDDIKAMFENYEYDLKYNYSFILGRWDRSPKAILGIDKDYALVREPKIHMGTIGPTGNNLSQVAKN